MGGYNIETSLNDLGFEVSLNNMKRNNLVLNLLSADNWYGLYNISKFILIYFLILPFARIRDTNKLLVDNISHNK